MRRRHPTRYYDVDGKRLPSVTSILGRTEHIFNPSKAASLEWWRKKEPKHEEIVDNACRRGSIIHSEIELALTGTQSVEYTVEEWVNLNIPGYVNNLLGFLHEIQSGDIIEVEKVVNHPAGYAGTADLVCEYQGQPTIVDFKTTRSVHDVGEKTKKRSHYQSAELQIAAYGAAYNTKAKNPVNQGMIVVAYDWKEPDIHVLDTDDLIRRASQFQERLEVFRILENT